MPVDKSHLMTGGALSLCLAAFTLGVWLPEKRAAQTLRERIATAEEKLGPNFNQPTAR